MISKTPILTERGKNLLMRAIGGEEITFTRFKAGMGLPPYGNTGAGLVDLVIPVLSFPISEMDDTQDGILALTGEFDNSDVEEDFPWREFGIFAKGEDNEEILYAYVFDRSNNTMIRHLNTEVVTTQTVTMIIAVGEAQNVTAVYVPDQQYATAVNLESHTSNKDNPHNVTKAQIGLDKVQNRAVGDTPIYCDDTVLRTNIVNGDKVVEMFGKIKKVIAYVLPHVDQKNNPHEVTCAQIGAASSTHVHHVSGIYTGDGTTKRGINLGFVPSAVLLYDEYGSTFDSVKGVRGGLAVGISGIRVKASQDSEDATTWDNQYTALLPGEDTENDFAGFYVNYYSGTDASDSISTNESGVNYRYIAYR